MLVGIQPDAETFSGTPACHFCNIHVPLCRPSLVARDTQLEYSAIGEFVMVSILKVLTNLLIYDLV